MAQWEAERVKSAPQRLEKLLAEAREYRLEREKLLKNLDPLDCPEIGRWCKRPLEPGELQMIDDIAAENFHKLLLIPMGDVLYKNFGKIEVDAFDRAEPEHCWKEFAKHYKVWRNQINEISNALDLYAQDLPEAEQENWWTARVEEIAELLKHWAAREIELRIKLVVKAEDRPENHWASPSRPEMIHWCTVSRYRDDDRYIQPAPAEAKAGGVLDEIERSFRYYSDLFATQAKASK